MLRVVLLLLVAVGAFAQNGIIVDGLLNGAQVSGQVPASAINPGGCAAGYFPNGSYTNGIANCSQIQASQIYGTFTLAQLPTSVLSNGETFTGTSTVGANSDVIFNNSATPGGGHTLLGLISNGSSGLVSERANTTYANLWAAATGTANNDSWSFGTSSGTDDFTFSFWNGTTATNWLTFGKSNSIITAYQQLLVQTNGGASTPMITAYETAANGYATYGLQNDTGQVFQFSLGSSGSVFPNTFYLYDSKTSVAPLTVAPTTDNVTVAKALTVSGNLTTTNNTLEDGSGDITAKLYATAKEHISGVNTVTFSATPTFDLSLGALQKITLTGSVTSSTVSNIKAGEVVTFQICQSSSGSGGYTFAWPTSVHGGMTIGTTKGDCSMQQFASWDGTTLYAVAAGLTNIP